MRTVSGSFYSSPPKPSRPSAPTHTSRSVHSKFPPGLHLFLCRLLSPCCFRIRAFWDISVVWFLGIYVRLLLIQLLSTSAKLWNSWTGLPQSLCAPREDPAFYRREVEPPWTTSSLRLRRPKDARAVRCPPNDVLWRIRRCDEQLYRLVAAIGTVNIDYHVVWPYEQTEEVGRTYNNIVIRIILVYTHCVVLFMIV